MCHLQIFFQAHNLSFHPIESFTVQNFNFDEVQYIKISFLKFFIDV